MYSISAVFAFGGRGPGYNNEVGKRDNKQTDYFKFVIKSTIPSQRTIIIINK